MPAHSPDRAGFLRGFAGRAPAPLRPPWARPEAEFVATCSRCEACLKVCPEAVLRRGAGGFPQLDFTRGECTFCRACLESCRDGALRTAASPWNLRARIDLHACLAFLGVLCRVCGEQCESGAISFRLRAEGQALPELDLGRCSGCGACYAPCPARAVNLAAAKPG